MNTLLTGLGVLLALLGLACLILIIPLATAINERLNG